MSGSFESVRWNACTDKTSVYTLIRKNFRERSQNPCTGGSEEGRTSDATSRRTASPTHYRLSYCGPTDCIKMKDPPPPPPPPNKTKTKTKQNKNTHTHKTTTTKNQTNPKTNKQNKTSNKQKQTTRRNAFVRLWTSLVQTKYDDRYYWRLHLILILVYVTLIQGHSCAWNKNLSAIYLKVVNGFGWNLPFCWDLLIW